MMLICAAYPVLLNQEPQAGASRKRSARGPPEQGATLRSTCETERVRSTRAQTTGFKPELFRMPIHGLDDSRASNYYSISPYNFIIKTNIKLSHHQIFFNLIMHRSNYLYKVNKLPHKNPVNS